jgi:hypothetical protein
MSEEVRPEYGKNSLVEIPGTIFSLLDIENSLSRLSKSKFEGVDTDIENVVFVLIDAFGSNQWNEFGAGIFGDIADVGKVSRITSTFPSMTPATLTTLSTGLQPVEHGLLGWEMYFDEIDSKLLTLPFTTTDWEDPSELFEAESNPEILFEGNPIYEKLVENEVRSYSLLNEDIAGSEYTELSHKGSEVTPYLNIPDMALKARRILGDDGKKYLYSYISEIDTVAHREGPLTEDEENQIEMISNSLKRNLVEKLDMETAENTLLLISADHGQIESDKKIDLMKYDKVEKSLKKDADGETITPCGGGRSVFLHVKEDRIEELQKFLNKELNAEVMKTKEAVREELFGDRNPGEKFYARAGELVIIPHGKDAVWFDTEEIEQVGFHGGLHPQEMNIPFAAVNLGDLKKELSR